MSDLTRLGRARPCFASEGDEAKPLAAALVALLRRSSNDVPIRHVPCLGSAE